MNGWLCWLYFVSLYITMIQTPLISTIIPFFDAGSWLREAIESVFNQVYTNWEIILVNDGSHQEDFAIAMEYAQKFPSQIFYVEHEGRVNKGLPFSRNAGIKKAHGQLIAFLDADDYWLPAKLERQLAIFKEFPQVQMICEASCFWYSWRDATCEDELILVGAPQGIYYPPQLMEILYPLGEGQPPCPTGIIINRDALERSGGFEERFCGVYQLYEDQAFLSKVYSKEIIYISDQANNLYRKRPNSMSSAANDESLYKKVRLFYLAWLQEYFQNTLPVQEGVQKHIDDFKSRLLASDHTSGITA